MNTYRLFKYVNTCFRYFKKSPGSSVDGIPVLFSLKSAKLPKSKKYFSKCKHQLYFHQTLRFNIQNCSCCKDIIWNVSSQYEAYQCSLCTITIHKFPCLDNLVECSMANSKQKKRGGSHRIDSPELYRREAPPIHILSLISPPPTTTNFSHNSDHSILKRLQPTEPINPHQLSATSKTNSKFLSLKSSKSSVFRSFSDRSSDRNTYVSALRHRNSLKYETKEIYVPSPSHKSTNTSSNSISNLSESDGSLISSSTNRSQDSPASAPAPSEDGSTEAVPAYNIRGNEWWRNDEHIIFDEPLIPWSQTADESLKQDMKKYEMLRQDLIWELIYTERTHMRKLKVMLFVFKQPLLKLPQIVSRMKVEDQLFPKLEEIVELHMGLLTSLLGRQQAYGGPNICVSDILIEWFTNENATCIKHNHTAFSIHSDEATAIFNTWRRGKDSLKQEFILKAEQDECCKRLGISQLLALVWQRMTRYHIFIENIINTYKEECEELKNLREALTYCNLTVGGIDDAINEKLNREALHRYQEKFESFLLDSSKLYYGFSSQYMSDSETKLLHHGVLNWKIGKNKTIDVHALLFSDLFVLLEYDENKDKYFLKRYQSTAGKNQEEISPIISLSDLIFRDQARNKASFFVCNLESGRDPKLYDFSTTSKTERDKWETLINKAVGKFAKRNQKLERNEKEREEHFKQYKERTKKKEQANRSISTPQPPSDIPNIRPHVISSISQPLQEMSQTVDVEILCEISSPTAENFLDNIPESLASLSEDDSYNAEKQRLATLFTERIPAYCDPYIPSVNNNHNTQSPILETKTSYEEKKGGWLRGFDRMRSLSSQGHRDDISRPRSVSDRDFIINSFRDDSKSVTDLSTSLQPSRKSTRFSVPHVSKHPLFKTEMCPIPFDDCLIQNNSLSSHLNKSESSLVEKPREERKSLSSIFKGFKPRKSSKHLKEGDYSSSSLPRRSSNVSLTPNAERRILYPDPEGLLDPSEYTRQDPSPDHRTSDMYRRISQDKSVSLDSLEVLSPTFKEQN